MMIDNKIRFGVERSIYRRNIMIYAMARNIDGSYARAMPATFKEETEEGPISPDPLLELSVESAQNLMDELWTAGIRPAEGQGSVGQLKATQSHLQDMRRLVFDEKESE